MTLPPANSGFADILRGYFGTGDIDGVVSPIDLEEGMTYGSITDQNRSELWANFLNASGLSVPREQLGLTYNIANDPNFLLAEDISNFQGFRVGVPEQGYPPIIWQAYARENGLPYSFNPDAPPNAPAQVGSHFWFEYLISEGLPLSLDPNEALRTAELKVSHQEDILDVKQASLASYQQILANTQTELLNAQNALAALPPGDPGIPAAQQRVNILQDRLASQQAIVTNLQAEVDALETLIVTLQANVIAEQASKTNLLNDFTTFANQARIDLKNDFISFINVFKQNLEATFLQFVQGILQGLQNQAINIQSADEIKKRDIMMRTFDVLLEMLQALQNTIGVIGRNLLFYGKWQEQYTNALTNVPIYSGGTSSLPNIPEGVQVTYQRTLGIVTGFNTPASTDVDDPAWDWGNFTFGYNDISVQDIADWYVDRSEAGDGAFFAIQSPEIAGTDANGIDFPRLQVLFRPEVRDANGNITQPGSITWERRETISGDLQITAAQSYEAPASSDSKSLDTAFKESFIAFWRDGDLNSIHGQVLGLDSASGQEYEDNKGRVGSADIESTVTPSYTSMQIPWLHSFSVSLDDDPSDKDKKFADVAAKARGEQNAVLQQYIENIRSRRQIVQNLSKQVESNLSQAKESVSQMGNLLNSIIESMKSLISSIFR